MTPRHPLASSAAPSAAAAEPTVQAATPPAAGSAGGPDPSTVTGTPPPAVCFRHVWKRYGSVEALRDVTFTLPAGTVTGLVGANGSGKSTLLKVAAGFVRPARGEVQVLGQTPGVELRRRVAFVAEVDPLDPWMTVDQTVRFVRSFFTDWDPEHEGELREILELPGRRRVGELSKGMRTRVRLLLGLARSAPLVLLDEPFSGIDPVSRRRIADAILAACRRAAGRSCSRPTT